MNTSIVAQSPPDFIREQLLESLAVVRLARHLAKEAGLAYGQPRAWSDLSTREQARFRERAAIALRLDHPLHMAAARVRSQYAHQDLVMGYTEGAYARGFDRVASEMCTDVALNSLAGNMGNLIEAELPLVAAELDTAPAHLRGHRLWLVATNSIRWLKLRLRLEGEAVRA